MQLTEIGRYADLQLQNVKTHYPYAEIPVWVVMPNHLHAIVNIRGCRAVAAKKGWLSVCIGCIRGYSSAMNWRQKTH